jgi:DNA 3'-phosphatase
MVDRGECNCEAVIRFVQILHNDILFVQNLMKRGRCMGNHPYPTMASYVFTPPGACGIPEGPVKIALFDLDGTLITSRRGHKWARTAEDCLFLTPSVCPMLRKYNEKGWVVAIITNQAEWHKDKGKTQDKVESVLRMIADACDGWQPWCLVATGPTTDTEYRKPARGLFDLLLLHLGIVDMKRVEGLLMCGDAAGIDDPYPLYRWSDVDKGFAERFGFAAAEPRNGEEMVVLMGPPGSGKSTTARAFAAVGYEWIEQDAVNGDARRTKRVVEERLAAGARRLVVDATHSSAAHRGVYAELAREAGLPFRVLWHVKDGRPFNALRERPVPEIAYAVYAKHFTDPRMDGVRVEMVT